MAGFDFSKIPQETVHISTEYRTIQTKLPVPESIPILDELEANESTSMHGQMPIIWDRAENFQVYDKWGNCWIDFTSTIFVTNTGHGNKTVIDRVMQVLQKPLIHSYTYTTEIRNEYISKLLDFAPSHLDKVFLLSAGTEATECAMKLMRMNGQKNGKRKPGILCLGGNWHGRTMGAQMMSNNALQRGWIGYDDPNIHHLPFPYPWSLKNESGDAFFKRNLQEYLDQQKNLDPKQDFCGVMLETFQGWGAIFYPKDFVIAVESFCRENNMLLAFDEMQSGFGRTGKRFGYEHYEVKPDLLCCGKGMGSGFPISGVIGSQQVMDLPEVGSMSSTHSANPIVCAAGLGTLEAIIEGSLVEESARKGKILHQGLQEIQDEFPDNILYIFGKGLLASILFFDPKSGAPDCLSASYVCEAAMMNGLLLVHTGRESIKIAPPLTISDAALMEGLSVLKDSIARVLKCK